MSFKPKRIIRKIKKIFAYIPFLWKEDDFGYEDLLKLIQFKVTRMEEHIRLEGACDEEETEEVCKSMRKFLKSLNLAINPTTFDDVSFEAMRKMSATDLRALNIKEDDEITENWNKACDIFRAEARTWAD